MSTKERPEYLVDGYNLLFFILESKSSFESQRNELICHLQKKFAKLKLRGTLVFDGSHRRDEGSGLSYKSPLEIVYTPKGQSADAYIIEKVMLTKNPKLLTVVTNDQGLIKQSRYYNVNILKIPLFFQLLEKQHKESQETKKEKETKYNVDRLLKIFEDRFKSF